MGLKAKTVMLHAGCGRQVDACRSLAPALNRAPQAGALGPSAAASYSDRARAHPPGPGGSSDFLSQG
jgi:hypothetical protein